MKVVCTLIVLLYLEVGRAQYFQLFNDGSYDFNYHTSGGQHRSEVRYPDGTVLGKYAYVAPNGQKIDVEYSAGTHGYKEKRKLSKPGIKKTAPRLKIQTHPPYGIRNFPYSNIPPQVLESPKRFPVFRPNSEIGDSSAIQHPTRFGAVPIVTPTTRRPLKNTNRFIYPSEDESETPPGKPNDFHSNTGNIGNVVQKLDELLWIPSTTSKPRMPGSPIWRKPVDSRQTTLPPVTRQPVPITNQNRFFPSTTPSANVSNLGLIIREPIRRPIPLSESLMSTTTTKKPMSGLQERTDRPHKGGCFHSPSPLKKNSTVFVKHLGKSGILNIKPFEIITPEMLRQANLDIDNTHSNSASNIHVKRVVNSRKGNLPQPLPSNGFDAIPEHLQNQNEGFERFHSNFDPSTFQQFGPLQKIRSQPLTIQISENDKNAEVVPFPPPPPANFQTFPERTQRLNLYEYGFRVPFSYHIPEQIESYPIRLQVFSDTIQPRKD